MDYISCSNLAQTFSKKPIISFPQNIIKIKFRLYLPPINTVFSIVLTMQAINDEYKRMQAKLS